MRTVVLAAFLVLWSSGASYAGPRDDAMAVIDKWLQAFGASDVDGITRLYAPDALFDVTYATRDGKTIENPGRFTFVVARRGADWQIVHFHRSGVPGGGGR